MYKGLREFISVLESNGELIRIKEFADPVLEIAEITDRVSKMEGGGKALLFENTGTPYPVITNMLGSQKRIALALGVKSLNEIGEQIDELAGELMLPRVTFMDKLKLLPHLREASRWFPKKYKGDAPCQEVILATPDINRFPVLQCWPQDGGRFITLPLVHTNDPKTGARNVGMYRMQIFSGNTTGMHWHRHKTGARHLRDCKGDKLPVAVCLGGDPVYTYAATAPLPDGIDEYLLAGFLRGSGVELTDCVTQDIRVPADCDIVIEGYVSTKEEPVIEGPFGDHTGFYSLPDLYPRFHITCITHRRDAIYPATLVGIPPQEDKYIALATEKIFLSPIKLTMAPEITDMFLPEEGVGHNLAIVSINKNYPGQAVKVAHSLWGAGQMMFNKIIIITDSTCNIRDWKEVQDAICKNYTPKKDTHFGRGPLDVLDHTAPQCGYGGKMVIDATAKLPEEGINEHSNREAIKFIHNTDEASALINIIIDPHMSPDDRYTALWLWGSNCDPVRDSSFKEGLLISDSTTKVKGQKGFNRDWPGYAISSAQTIESVDQKWEKYGIGDFIVSPSRKFLTLSKQQELEKES